jgi:hypothetical protein
MWALCCDSIYVTSILTTHATDDGDDARATSGCFACAWLSRLKFDRGSLRHGTDENAIILRIKGRLLLAVGPGA